MRKEWTVVDEQGFRARSAPVVTIWLRLGGAVIIMWWSGLWDNVTRNDVYIRRVMIELGENKQIGKRNDKKGKNFL